MALAGGRRPFVLAAIVAAMLGVAGCGEDAPTAPSDPEPTTIFESFRSTVQPLGSASRTFVTTTSGAINVTLVGVGQADAEMELSLGVTDAPGAPCSPTVTVLAVASGAAQISTSLGPGRYCVRIADVGNLRAVSTFTISIERPS